MRLDIEQMDGGITRVAMVGQLDMQGAGQIDLEFATVVGRTGRMVVDLSQLTFIASIGLRTLIINAKAMKSRGSHMVLAGATPCVTKVLASAGVDQIIPTVADVAAAVRAFPS